jgi:hypothetical protein
LLVERQQCRPPSPLFQQHSFTQMIALCKFQMINGASILYESFFPSLQQSWERQVWSKNI